MGKIWRKAQLAGHDPPPCGAPGTPRRGVHPLMHARSVGSAPSPGRGVSALKCVGEDPWWSGERVSGPLALQGERVRVRVLSVRSPRPLGEGSRAAAGEGPQEVRRVRVLDERMVDLGGFEPPASSMPLRRAPNCATGPRLGRAGEPGSAWKQDSTRLARRTRIPSPYKGAVARLSFRAERSGSFVIPSGAVDAVDGAAPRFSAQNPLGMLFDPLSLGEREAAQRRVRALRRTAVAAEARSP